MSSPPQPRAAAPAESYVPSRCNFMYLCIIDADGTFKLGPEGWTAAKTGVGTYTITHHLGRADYMVLPVAIAALATGTPKSYQSIAAIDAATADDLTLETYSGTQITDCPFGLLIVQIQ